EARRLHDDADRDMANDNYEGSPALRQSATDKRNEAVAHELSAAESENRANREAQLIPTFNTPLKRKTEELENWQTKVEADHNFKNHEINLHAQITQRYTQSSQNFVLGGQAGSQLISGAGNAGAAGSNLQASNDSAQAEYTDAQQQYAATLRDAFS